MPRFQCIHHTHSRTRTHHPAPNSLGLAPADRLLSLPPSARYTCCPGRWEWYEVALQRFPHSSSWGGGPPAWCLDSSIPPAQSSKQPDCRRGTYCTAQYSTAPNGAGDPTQGTSLQRRAARYLGPRPSASRPVCAQYRWRGSSTVHPLPPARTPLYLAFPGTCTRCGPVRLPSLCLGPFHHFHSLPLPPRPSSLLCFLSSSAAPLLGVVSTSLFLTKPILLHLPAGKEASPFRPPTSTGDPFMVASLVHRHPRRPRR